MNNEFSFNMYKMDFHIKTQSVDYKVLDVRYNNKTTSENGVNAVSGRSELHIGTETKTILTVGEENGFQRVISVEGEFPVIKDNTVSVVSVSGGRVRSEALVDLYVLNRNNKIFSKLCSIKEFKDHLKVEKGFSFANIESTFVMWAFLIVCMFFSGIGILFMFILMWCGFGKQIKAAEQIFTKVELQITEGSI